MTDDQLIIQADRQTFRSPITLLFLLLLTLIVKSAWLGDDAYIPIRSIDNLLNGYGFRWNIDERVQVFTDPLWTLLIAGLYAVTHEIFITVIVMSIVTSLAAVWVLAKHGSVSSAASVAALAALVSSKAFVDYTTSGLENCLSYLLIAVFCALLFRGVRTRNRLRWLVLVYALLGANRLDLLLLLFPAVILETWATYRSGRMSLRAVITDGVLFSLPLWGWLLFAAIYFGYALPNTYYAKLYTGIPTVEHIKQGLLYFLNSVNYDSLTLVVIGLAMFLGIRSDDLRLKSAALGLLLYLLYIVKIGGDFMSGRFFSVPFFFAVALLVQLRLSRAVWLCVAAFCLGLGLTAKYPTLFYNEEYKGVIENPDVESRTSDVTDRRGIADERGWYFRDVGLLTVLKRQRATPQNGWAFAGQEARRRQFDMVEFSTPGLYGYYAGPGVHIIDTFALGDPLLSRLPVVDKHHWKVGHYGRAIPAGYVETIESGENEIVDPKVHELYRVTAILTRDPIWSWSRLKEIVKANVGCYNSLIRSAPRNGVAPPLAVGEIRILPNRRRGPRHAAMSDGSNLEAAISYP